MCVPCSLSVMARWDVMRDVMEENRSFFFFFFTLVQVLEGPEALS